MSSLFISRPFFSRIRSLTSTPYCSAGAVRSMTTGKGQMGDVERTIHTKLKDHLTPLYLEVINESYMHNVPKGSESHFKVVVVSDKFEGMALIKRHRLVMDLLGEELQQGVHALSIQADTPARWESRAEKVTQSPPCLGGSKR